MTILVLGSSGQLASHLRALLPDARFCGRHALDLADTAAIEPAVIALAPSVIINAAAYTAVDKAESEPDAAWRLNAEAPAALARAAQRLGVPLVQVSTDYVFDGSAPQPYTPDQPVRPLSVYGASKLAGEIAVRTLCERHWILRTSWVFSEFGQNFVRTMLRVAREGRALRIVSDQRGRPTWAGDLAASIAQLIACSEKQAGGAPAQQARGGPGRALPRAEAHADKPPCVSASVPYGTWHAVGGAAVSWYEFAGRIFELAIARGLLQRMPDVTAVPTADYPTPAARPLNAVLAPSPELEALGVTMDWQAGLATVLDRRER